MEAHARRLELNRKELVSGSDPLRAPHRLALEQTRAQVSHKFSIAKHRKRREDVIIEDAIPDLTTLFQMLGGMAPAQRPLRPVRTERKPVTIQDLSGQDVKLLLCVVRAYDVPVRQDVAPVREGPRESQVAPFLEATFQVGFIPLTQPTFQTGEHTEDWDRVRTHHGLEPTAGAALQAAQQ